MSALRGLVLLCYICQLTFCWYVWPERVNKVKVMLYRYNQRMKLLHCLNFFLKSDRNRGVLAVMPYNVSCNIFRGRIQKVFVPGGHSVDPLYIPPSPPSPLTPVPYTLNPWTCPVFSKVYLAGVFPLTVIRHVHRANLLPLLRVIEIPIAVDPAAFELQVGTHTP